MLLISLNWVVMRILCATSCRFLNWVIGIIWSLCLIENGVRCIGFWVWSFRKIVDLVTFSCWVFTFIMSLFEIITWISQLDSDHDRIPLYLSQLRKDQTNWMAFLGNFHCFYNSSDSFKDSSYSFPHSYPSIWDRYLRWFFSS